MSTSPKKVLAFTLVELLVVIGIIAVLISILIPTLGRIRKQGNTVVCTANLRGIGQAIFAYQADNRGSFPWGRANNTFDPVTGAAIAPTTVFFWSTLLDARFARPGRSGLWDWSVATGRPSKIFQCPEALADSAFNNPVHFQWNMAVMVSPQFELGNGNFVGVNTPTATNRNILRRPANGSRVYADTALMWDAPLHAFINASSYSPGGFGYTYIDAGQLCYVDNPEYRFRDSQDYYVGDPSLSWAEMIYVPSKASYSFSNMDNFSTTGSQRGQLGVPRWRHGKDNQCNVLFADGSVQTKSVNWSKQGAGGVGTVWNDFLRKEIMAKFPAGISPSSDVVP